MGRRKSRVRINDGAPSGFNFLRPPKEKTMSSALFARNAFILASPTLLFLSGIPTASYRLASQTVSVEEDRRYGYAFLIGAAVLTAFTTLANCAEVAPDLKRLVSSTCHYPKSTFPCRSELTDLFAFVFLLAFHPVLLAAALLYVNETDWKDKDTIKRWLWSLLLLSVLIYCVNGLIRTNYWFGYGRGG